MNIEYCIIKSKDWLRELKYKQLQVAICGEVDYDLDKTIELFESLLSHLEDCSDVEEPYNEMILSLQDEYYEKGYNQAIEDVVFELNNQGVDSDIIALIEDM